ncbi:MAG: hypothetical protein ACP5GU_08660 [Thermoprotei archaeon]|jgi:hypothetical protein
MNSTNYRRLLLNVIFVIIGGLAITTMVNAPLIFVGYGFIYVVMLLASWIYRPLTAATMVLITLLIALPFYIFTSSIFLIVVVLSIILRPILTYLTSYINLRYGHLTSALFLSLFESLIVLSIAISYYGDDGIHTGFTIFSILLLPFVYAIFYSMKSSRDKYITTFASLISLFSYYLALYAFFALLTLLLSILSLIILLFWIKNKHVSKILNNLPKVAFVLGVIGLILGGQAVFYNASAAFYSFIPANWNSEARWSQHNLSLCPSQNNVFLATHDPERLRIINTCVSVIGIVSNDIEHPSDGDFTFDLIPISQNVSTLTIGSYLLRHGRLHIEVVPADQHSVLDPIGGGVCPGDRVKVTGVLVIDTDHGLWSEIHPAYSIQIINRSTNTTWPSCIIGHISNE